MKGDKGGGPCLLNMGYCRHYTYSYRPFYVKCDLGIDIRGFVGGNEIGWMNRKPCYRGHKQGPRTCKRFAPEEKA